MCRQIGRWGTPLGPGGSRPGAELGRLRPPCAGARRPQRARALLRALASSVVSFLSPSPSSRFSFPFSVSARAPSPVLSCPLNFAGASDSPVLPSCSCRVACLQVLCREPPSAPPPQSARIWDAWFGDGAAARRESLTRGDEVGMGVGLTSEPWGLPCVPRGWNSSPFRPLGSRRLGPLGKPSEITQGFERVWQPVTWVRRGLGRRIKADLQHRSNYWAPAVCRPYIPPPAPPSIRNCAPDSEDPSVSFANGSSGGEGRQAQLETQFFQGRDRTQGSEKWTDFPGVTQLRGKEVIPPPIRPWVPIPWPQGVIRPSGLLWHQTLRARKRVTGVTSPPPAGC